MIQLYKNSAAVTAVVLALTGCATPMTDWRKTYNRYPQTGRITNSSEVGAQRGDDKNDGSSTGHATNARLNKASNGGGDASTDQWSESTVEPLPVEPRDPGRSMDDAILYLKTARVAYQKAISDQASTEANMSQGLLVGTGALLAAAGLRAHADTFVAGGAALSTSYAMGAAGMPRTRILAYMAGVDALNCAEASVAPIRTFQPAELKAANENLRTAAGKLKSVLEGADKEKNLPKDFIGASQSAEETLKAANGMVASTDDFLAKTQAAAYLLANQVDKVDAAVTRSIVNGMPNLADIKILSGAIGSDITGIVGKAANDANSSKQADGRAPGSDKSRSHQSEKAAEIRGQQDAVIDAMQSVRTQLPVNASNINMQAMTDCGLPSIPAPLMTDTTIATFFTKTAMTKSIEIRGGTKEYVADVKQLPVGLTVKQPGPTGTTLELVATDELADIGTYNLHIHDQTQGGNGVIVRITVAQQPENGTNGSASAVRARTAEKRKRK